MNSTRVAYLPAKSLNAVIQAECPETFTSVNQRGAVSLNAHMARLQCFSHWDSAFTRFWMANSIDRISDTNEREKQNQFPCLIFLCAWFCKSIEKRRRFCGLCNRIIDAIAIRLPIWMYAMRCPTRFIWFSAVQSRSIFCKSEFCNSSGNLLMDFSAWRRGRRRRRNIADIRFYISFHFEGKTKCIHFHWLRSSLRCSERKLFNHSDDEMLWIHASCDFIGLVCLGSNRFECVADG